MLRALLFVLVNPRMQCFINSYFDGQFNFVLKYKTMLYLIIII